MWVRVARIGKPFGIAGEVTVQTFTDEPDTRFATGSHLSRSDSGAGLLTVARAHGVGGRWTLLFDGVDDRGGAESLRGVELFAEVADDERPATGADDWYDRQLIGLPCLLPDGAPVGHVVAVEHLPAQELLVVRTAAGHNARIPFVSQIVTDVGADHIVLDPPAGLLDPDLEASDDRPGQKS